MVPPPPGGANTLKQLHKQGLSVRVRVSSQWFSLLEKRDTKAYIQAKSAASGRAFNRNSSGGTGICFRVNTL